MKCPNCQNEIPANSKFCTYCGFQIPQVAATGAQPQGTQPQFGPSSQASQPNQFGTGQAGFNQGPTPQPQPQPNFTQPNQGMDMDRAMVYTKNYWSFLMHGVRRPTDYAHTFNKYFGLISLLLGSLFIALTVTLAEDHVAGNALSDLDRFAHTNTASEVGFGTFFGFLLLSLIGEFVLYSMAHLVARGFLGDRSAGYMEDMSRYAHISSIGLLVAGVGFILSIFGSFAIPIAMICLAFYNVMLSISYIALIFRAQPTNNFDPVYAYLVSLVVLMIVFVVLFIIIGASIGAGLLGDLTNLL